MRDWPFILGRDSMDGGAGTHQKVESINKIMALKNQETWGGGKALGGDEQLWSEYIVYKKEIHATLIEGG